ncbi:3-ketoacyl-CoA thiolase [Xylogone sp. PMI_703]|nr:3-ketoacyl-CoA thiolase [Xylogone sp. PMI_703]
MIFDITCAIRTPFTKAHKGDFKDTTLEYIVYALLKLESALVENICMGNVGEFAPGYKIRSAALAAGFPNTTGAGNVNRICASGLKATVEVAHQIMASFIEIGIAVGAESMTFGQDRVERPFDLGAVEESQEAADVLQSIGWTRENISREFEVSRETMDSYAAESYRRAEAAQKAGYPEGGWKEIILTQDDGIGPGTTLKGLSNIKGAFQQWGSTTTAGNASQITDGGELRQPILAKYVGSIVTGLASCIMSIGPSIAIPKLLRQYNLTMVVYCHDKLKLDRQKMNPRGGAIALSHPLGATDVRQIDTGLILLISMCVGGGQGMAGLFVNEQQTE